MDETTAPVLDPGPGKIKKGFFWAIACDDRGHDGQDRAIVLFHYAPGRGGEHAERFPQGVGGQFLQVDAYVGYDRLTRLERSQGPWKLVLLGPSTPTVREAGAQYQVPHHRSRRAPDRHALRRRGDGARHDATKLGSPRDSSTLPRSSALKPWFEKQLSMISSAQSWPNTSATGLPIGKGSPASSMTARLELDTNPVENAIRPICLTRKNALFAGHEVGGESWALLSSIVATCKLNDVNPVAYLAETLDSIING